VIRNLREHGLPYEVRGIAGGWYAVFVPEPYHEDDKPKQPSRADVCTLRITAWSRIAGRYEDIEFDCYRFGVPTLWRHRRMNAHTDRALYIRPDDVDRLLVIARIPHRLRVALTRAVSTDAGHKVNITEAGPPRRKKI